MAFIEKTFLHFFDIHYLDEKGLKTIPNKIYKEAFYATRFAILCSEKVYIPASSYFESPICRKIINQYLSIIPLGIIWLVGKAHNYREFFQGKVIQYANIPDQSRLYESALKSEIEIPFHRRLRSSTKDISSNWIRTLNFSEVPDIFETCSGFQLPSDIEAKWENVPDLLGGNAFIVQNVTPLLFSDPLDNFAVINRLHGVINKSYFQSYINELNASIISDMVALESNYPISNNTFNIPYSYIIRELTLRDHIDSVKNYRPEDLILFRDSDSWRDVFCAAIEKKERSESDIGKIYSKKTQRAQYLIKELKMGDTYNIHGQTGAVGPGARAHDINFNQLWKDIEKNVDLEKLSNELVRLRTEAQKMAQTPEHSIAIGELASAEVMAKTGNGKKMLEHLQKAGKWLMDISVDIGTNIATEFIKKSMWV